MKKSHLLALALAMGATGASAQMQGRPTPSSPPEQHPDRPGMGGMGHDDMGQGRMSDQNNHSSNGGPDMRGGGMDHPMSGSMHGDMTMHRHMMPPRHWSKGRTAWSHHMQSCSTRYRSYDPRTDMYVVRMGMKRRCML